MHGIGLFEGKGRIAGSFYAVINFELQKIRGNF